MKKVTVKRTIALIGAMLIGASAFAGCKSEQKSGLEGYSSRPNKVSVVYNKNAYGKEWITQIAKAYMDNHNTDTYIDLEQTYTPEEDFSKVQVDASSADLYLFDRHLKDLKGHAEDLTDVWDGYAIGEEGKAGAKKIKDKLVPLLANQEDHYGTRTFTMPYSQATTFGWVYNTTVLNEAFPDGYTLPRTTDELFEFGDKVKGVQLSSVDEKQDVYLLVCSLGDTNENLRYAHFSRESLYTIGKRCFLSYEQWHKG